MSIFIVRGPEGRGPLQHAAAPIPDVVSTKTTTVLLTYKETGRIPIRG